MFAGLSAPEAYLFIPQDPPASVNALEERYRALAHGVSPDGHELWLNWMLRCHAGDYIGFVQATVRREKATAFIAYQLFPRFWRQGYGREAVAAMLDYLAVSLDVHKAFAFIDTRNTASHRLVEALGFSRAGLIENADYFKGASSDEFEYCCDLLAMSRSQGKITS